MLIGTIAGGILTFIILFIWRTTQSDHLERIRPRDSPEDIKAKEFEIDKRRREL